LNEAVEELVQIANIRLFRAVFSEPKPFFTQQLNSSRWPIYCDHSVTSADVRQTVGNTHRRLLPQFSMRLDFKKKIVSSP
jgi:hypothetical protein